jgi:molybdate transport repressor ModE-like protein
MTFEQIRYFLALAEEGSFVRAARRCGISQPSLSNAIRSLEAALGAPLFERAVAGSGLTALGRRMHPLLARLHRDRLRALQSAHRGRRAAVTRGSSSANLI